MSDITVLDKHGDLTRVVLHFATPSGDNAVGTSWVNALIRSGIGGSTVMVDGDGTGGTISSTEKSGIEAGVIFEQVVNIDIDGSGSNNASRRGVLRAEWAKQSTNLTVHLANKLQFFGHNETSV